MSGTLEELALAMAVFVGSHLLLSAPPVRKRLLAVLGEKAFRGVYATVALAALVWAAIAYNHAPYRELWPPLTGLRHVPLTVMPIALFLVIGGSTAANPTMTGRDTATLAAAGPSGILTITRHPMMWGFALWGISHLLARGDVAALLLFGGLTVLALAGAAMIDLRKRLDLGEVWRAYERQTSFVPLVALIAGRTRLRFAEIGWRPIGIAAVAYVVLILVHPYVFGVNPWPM